MSVACSLDNDDALADGVADCQEVIRPPLDRDETELAGPGSIGSWAMKLSEYYVTRTQFVRRLPDRL